MNNHLSKFLNRFRKSEKGTTAIESAFLLPVFVVALVEGLSLLMFMHNSNSLDQAVKVTAAELRLNQARGIASANQWTSEEYFSYTVCQNLFKSDCVEKLSVDMQIYDLNGQPIGSPSDGFANSSSLVLITATLDSNLPTIFLDLPAVQAGKLFFTEPF